MLKRSYQICKRCIMDTSDPDIYFDPLGYCNHCNQALEQAKKIWFPNSAGQKKLAALVQNIKREEQGKIYNCIVGLSGGVDSSYLAYQVVKLGLKPLVVHVDCGWNSELAVNNIENIVKKLNLDLHTYVVNWQEMKDLQLAYFKANVANQDIPQDHAIIAALYKFAVQNKLKYVFNGANFATECILPKSWGYTNLDTRNLLAIHRKFGTRKLKTYPRISLFKYYIYFQFIRRMTIIKALNFMPYNKNRAIEIMKKDLDWQYYGGKHHESRFTKFFQAYYLPKKFGYDKRRAHLSSLIISHQITRAEALEKMKRAIYPDHSHLEDMTYVAKKLGLSLEAFQKLIDGSKRSYSDFPNQAGLLELGLRIKTKYFTT